MASFAIAVATLIVTIVLALGSDSDQKLGPSTTAPVSGTVSVSQPPPATTNSSRPDGPDFQISLEARNHGGKFEGSITTLPATAFEMRAIYTNSGTVKQEAGALLEIGQSKISGLLKGVGNISVGDLERLANKLGFTDPGHHAALFELRRDSHKRDFWSMGYRRAYREEIRLLIDLEQHADRIRWVEVEVVPGLVQCESYVQALYADMPDQDGISLDDHVQARIARQEILDKADPPNVHFVLSESCLRRVWGDAAVMREQINHLVKLSNRTNVMIQVMPFNAPPGRRSPIGHRFAMVRVPSPGVAGPLELAYTEAAGEIRYLDDKKALTAHEMAWARLMG